MEVLSSYCLTEPGCGSDASALRTKAERRGDRFVVNGEKQFISGAGAGARDHLYLVMARTGGDGPGGISALLVEGRTPGLTLGALERKMGWNAQPTRAVSFENCPVPVQNLLGAEGQGFKIAMAGLDGGRLNIGACSLGGGQAALDKTVRYLRERKAFGHSLDEFQALQFRLADMATELEAARALLWRAAAALGAGAAGAATLCAMAKRVATDAGFAVANDALQLHGGYGYLCDYGIEKTASVICGCIKFSKAPTKSCASSSRGTYWERRGDMSETDLLISRIGHLGAIRLNRPKALNSLTLGMVRGFARALDEFGWTPTFRPFC